MFREKTGLETGTFTGRDFMFEEGKGDEGFLRERRWRVFVFFLSFFVT